MMSNILKTGWRNEIVFNDPTQVPGWTNENPDSVKKSCTKLKGISCTLAEVILKTDSIDGKGKMTIKYAANR